MVEVWKTLGSFSAACLLLPMLIGQVFPGKISETLFITTVIAGSLGIIAWRILNVFYQFSSIDEFYVGLFLTTIILLPNLVIKKAK